MTRLEALRRLISRIDKRLVRLERLHRRVSWYRLGAFLATFLLAFAANFLLSGVAALMVLFPGLALFSVLVLAHHRVERVYRRNRHWRRIKSGHLARATLDWASLPSDPYTAPADHPFANDLDLTGSRSLFQLLNVAGSSGGSERLRGWLLDADPTVDKVKSRQPLIKELVPLSRFRDKLLLAFGLGFEGRLEGEKLVAWVAGTEPSGRLWVILLQAVGLLAINHFAVFAHLSGLVTRPYWEITLAAWFLFYLSRSRRVSPMLGSIVQLDDQLSALGRVLGFLQRYPYRRDSELGRLCSVFTDEKTRPSRQVGRAKLITGLAGLRMNPLAGLVLNVLLPWDFAVGYLISRLRERLALLLPLWLESSSQLEASVSLANFGYYSPGFAFPRIESIHQAPDLRQDGGFQFEARDLGHPLIPLDDRVTNDFFLQNTQLVVLTGSNMSGKSTFLKTLGVNTALAYAGGPVCASDLRLSVFRLFTCIRVTDSVQDHVSTFYAEVRRLRRLLDALEANEPRPVFYLVDEIFRGTNNRERVAGGLSFMQALLGKNGAGAISTHDLELAIAGEKLNRVRNFHFRETLAGGRMEFDYRLRPGISPTTNALKIMRLEGLPVTEG